MGQQEVYLHRFKHVQTKLDKAKGCTLGTLKLPNGWQCATIERPYLDNKVNVSSIPSGKYKVLPFSGNRHKDVYEVLDVPGRSAILIHVANWSFQVEGCIAVGREHIILNNLDAVAASNVTFDEFKDQLIKCKLQHGFTLQINNDY
jgi:hypothetical protein